MYKNFIELHIEGLTRGKELRDAFILVLREKQGPRFFPVLLDSRGYELISAALNKKDYTCSMLMTKLALRLGMTLIGARIMPPKNGRTQALLDFELINEVVSIAVPIAEAAVASLESHSSIWIERSAFETHTRNKQDKTSMALPIDAMNVQLLKAALHSAVEEENFELASILRDELRKRNYASINPLHEL